MKKRIFIYIGIMILLILLALFLFKGCDNTVSIDKQLRDSIQSGLNNYNTDRYGSDDRPPEEVLIEELIIYLETSDEECIMDETDCVGGCFDIMTEPCFPDYVTCEESCNEEFPITDEIRDCMSVCDTESDSCGEECEIMYLSAPSIQSKMIDFISVVPSACAIAPDLPFESDECYEDCEDIRVDCNNDCDSDYNECDYDCALEYFSPCVEATVDCVYDCLDSCIFNEEIVIWDGREVTDIGNFYETSFPEFDEQFKSTCNSMIMGDFVSSENKYGCTNFGFFGGWLTPYMRSIESAQGVCETIGGTWISTEDEVSCNT